MFSTIVNKSVENYVNKYLIKMENFVNKHLKLTFHQIIHLFSTAYFNTSNQLFPQPKFIKILDLQTPLLLLTNTPYYY
ncbi:MAG: hypothetical protein HN846_03460 [Candidatus Pacebacteria bacterium]|nr:hypothetical protein [Candidatus Paceibacterota bacterium]MBT3512125.1 hypothetical protein [Candidatus Paceibacterota bacterium]MBT4005413.1 hypothetical protein [Candidatus Paceibacterota bacterium]MBT4359122.1 hypothetical protein [Candidatus Paceibacterota bacterium]MBT4680961.1 hypothetical protein [Candidatus Paceibacterota bacterium]